MSHPVSSRHRRNGRKRHTTFKRLLQAELLEDRRLLTVSSMFDSGTRLLEVFSDEADGIVISQSFGQVKINGADPSTGPAFAEEVASIKVTATGDFPNTIDLSNMDPFLFGGVVSVILRGGAGDDLIVAPRISSQVFGEEGNDLLLSADGDDLVDGGAGNDRLIVLDGNDLYLGGPGDDTYEFAGNLPSGLGSNTFDESGGGSDTFDFGQFSSGVIVDLGTPATQLFSVGSEITIQPGSTIETLIGGQADDSLTAAAGVDTHLIGAGGDDTLVGSTGNDTLEGDLGSDTLEGGGGDDSFIIFEGQDTVLGGPGSDTLSFEFYASAGVVFDLDLVGLAQPLAGLDAVRLTDAVENVIGSGQADVFYADFLPGGIARSVVGGDPAVMPGDELIVDFQSQPGGYTMRGVGKGEYKILSSSFGAISFESIEAPTKENFATLNFTLQPEVPASFYKISREFDSVFFTNDSGDIYGSDVIDSINLLEVVGSDTVDDELIVDLTGGIITPPEGIHYSGGNGGNDLLAIVDGDTHEFIYKPSSSVFGSGEISEDLGEFWLAFNGLEPVEVSNSKSIDLSLVNLDDLLTVTEFSNAGEVFLAVSGSSGGVAIEELRVKATPTLTIDTTQNSADGNDTIEISDTTITHGVQNLAIITGSGNDVINANGHLILPGTLTIDTSGELKGTGNLDATVVLARGTLSPGDSIPGILTVGSIDFGASTSFHVELNGTNGGNGNDQLKVNGTLELGGTTLDTNGSSVVGAVPGLEIVLIDNDGVDAVAGTFAGLAEGSTIFVNGQSFDISYTGGDGNDVVLTARAVSPMDVYVDDDLAGTADGTVIADADPDTPGNQSGTFGVDVFATIVDGVAAANSGGTVHVVGGRYDEDIRISKPLILDGTSSNRRAARIGGGGISIESGGDNVILSDLLITSELHANSVVAPTLQNVISSGDVGLVGRNLTGALRIENSLFQANQFTAFDVDSAGLNVVIEDSVFQLNTLGPIAIQNVDSLSLRNTAFRGNTAGIAMRSIGTLTYDTERNDIGDEIVFNSNTLTHRRNGVDRDPLELLSVRNLVINTFGGADHITGQTNFSMTATIDTGNDLTGDSVTVEGSEISDSFSTTITGVNTELRNGTQAPVVLRGMESLILKGNAGADRFNISPTVDYAIMVDGGDPIGQSGEPNSFDVLNVVVRAQQVSYLNGPENDSGSIVIDDYLPISFDQVELAALHALPAPDGLPTFKSYPLPFGNPKGNPVDIESGGGGEVKVSQGNFQLTFSELESEEQVVLDLTESTVDVNFNFDGQPYAQDFVIRGSGENSVFLNGGGAFEETTLNLQEDGTVQVTINPTITLDGVTGLFVNSNVNSVTINGTSQADTFQLSDTGQGRTEVTFPLTFLGTRVTGFSAALPVNVKSLVIHGNGGADDFILSGVGPNFGAAISFAGGSGFDLVSVPHDVSLYNSLTVDADKFASVGTIDTSQAGPKGYISILGGTINVNRLRTGGGDIRLESARSINVAGEIRSGGGNIDLAAAEDVVLSTNANLDVESSQGSQRVSMIAGSQSVPAKVNGTLATGGSVDLPSSLQEGLPYAFSGDGEFIVYGADEQIDDHFEIYRFTPTTVSEQIAIQTNRSKDGFTIGQDFVAISYNTRQSRWAETVHGFDLRSGASLWQEVRYIESAFSFTYSPAEAFRLSPDATTIVTQANDGDTSGATSGYLLHGITIDKPGRHNYSAFAIPRGATGFSTAVVPQWEISPDSKSIFIITNGATDDIFQLYRAPIHGGQQTVFASAAAPDRDIGSFRIGSDSMTIAFVANNNVATADDIYVISPTLTSPLKLTPPALTSLRTILDYQIIRDQKSIVYISDQDVPGKFELYIVPITGGTATKINPQLAADRDVREFQLSADGKYVVYLADQNGDDQFDLFGVALSGGNPKQISAPAPSNRDVEAFQISPDGRRVVYTANYDSELRNDLYTVPIGGGYTQKLNSLPAPSKNVQDFTISNDGNRVAYRVLEAPGVYELYTAALPGEIIMADGSYVNARNAPVTLTAAGDILLSNVSTTGNLSIESKQGGIIDVGGINSQGNSGNNITAFSASIRARDGIGSTDTLETLVTGNLSFENSDQGNVSIHNAVPLTIGSFDGLTKSGNPHGNINLIASAITVAHDVSATNVSLTATESSSSNTNNIVVDVGVKLIATDTTDLRAGDDLTIGASAEVKADTINLRAGVNNLDSRGHMTLDGRIEALTGSHNEITLSARGAVRQSPTGIIRADDLLINGSDSFELFSTSNDVNSFSGITGGSVTYKDVDTVLVGPLTTTDADVLIEARQAISFAGDVNLGSGTLTLDAQAGASQALGDDITARAVLLKGRGIFALTNMGNDIDALASDLLPGTISTIAWTDRDDVAIASVGSIAGLTAPDGVTVRAPVIRLMEDIQTHAGDVELNARSTSGADGWIVVASANPVIDTGLGATVSGGDVKLLNATISADAAGRSLTIDTHSPGAGNTGGDVQLPLFSRATGFFAVADRRMLHELHIDTTGGTADGIVVPKEGVFLQNGGPNDLALLSISGDIRLEHHTVFSTSDGLGSAGVMDLKNTRTYATQPGINLLLDVSAPGLIGTSGDGGQILLGRFETPLNTFEIEDLTVLAGSALQTDGSATVNYDVHVDGDLRFEGTVLLPNVTTTLSTSSGVDSAGSIDLRTASVQPMELLGAPANLNLLASHTGGLATDNHGGNVWTGALTKLQGVSIDVSSNATLDGGRGGSVEAGVPGKVFEVTSLIVNASTGDRNLPSRVRFNSSISLGEGGMAIAVPDEVIFADEVTTSGAIRVEAARNVEFMKAQTGIDAVKFINPLLILPAIHLETRSPTGTIQLRGNLETDGKDVMLDGNIVLHESIQIDTIAGSGTAGDVSLLGKSLYPAKQGLQLEILTTDFISAGGNVTLDSEITPGSISDLDPLAYLNKLTIHAHGTTNGVVSLGNAIRLGGYSRFGAHEPSALTVSGDVRLTADVNMDLSDSMGDGGSVHLESAEFSSEGPISHNLKIDTRHTGSGSFNFARGGDVTLRQFVDPADRSPVGQLSIDMSSSSAGTSGGSFGHLDSLVLGTGLEILTTSGTLLFPSQVSLSRDVLVQGGGGVVIDGAYTINTTSTIASAGPVTFEAQYIALSASIDATYLDSLGNDVRLSADRLLLSGVIKTDGKMGRKVTGGIHLAGDVVVDSGLSMITSSGTSGPAGHVSITNGSISANSLGAILQIDTSPSAGSNDDGGDIVLPPITNSPGGAYLTDVDIDSQGAGTGVDGVIRPSAIRLSGEANGSASSLTMSGDVRIDRDLRLNTSESGAVAGGIDLRDAIVSATQPNLKLTLEARQTDPSSSANGGSIGLGNFGNQGGFFVGDLVVDGRASGSGLDLGVSLGQYDPIAIETSGDQTYFGPVLVSAPVVELSAHDVTLASTVRLSSNALVVTVNGTKSSAEDVISGDGTLSKRGGGTLTLEAINSYTGQTRVSDGVLSLGKFAVVNGVRVYINGGSLGGNGTVKAPVLMDPTTLGSIAPGGTPGLLTIDGDITFVDGGKFEVELDSVGDQLNVTGIRNFRLGDGLGKDAFLEIKFQTQPQVGEQFLLINVEDPTAPAVSGKFKNALGGIVANGTFRGRIDYAGGDGNDVVLTVLPASSMAEVNVKDSGLVTVGPSSGNGSSPPNSPTAASRFVLRPTDGGGLNISQPGSIFLFNGEVHQADNVDIQLKGRENVHLLGTSGQDELWLDLTDIAHELRLEAQTVVGLIEGLGIKVSGFATIRIVGNGDDNVTFASPTDVNSPIHVSGIDGGDLVSRAGNWGIVTSGLNELTIESTGGSGEVVFDVTSLTGANSYTANLAATNVARLEGNNALSDNLVIGRYGNAWHPIGAELKDGGANVRVAGAGRLEVRTGGGDDTLTIDVDQSRGSDLISLPIFFDGGEGGYDTLELVGTPTTAVENANYRPGPDTHNGSLEFTDAGQQRLMNVEFAGLEPVKNTVHGSFHNVYGTPLDENITYTTESQSAGLFAGIRKFGKVSIDDTEAYSFLLENVAVAPTLLLFGGGGHDRFDVALPSQPGIDALSGISVIGGATGIGTKREQAELILRGSSQSETFEFEADSTNLPYTRLYASRTGASNRVKIETDAIADIVIPASGGSDTLMINGSDNAEKLEFHPSLDSPGYGSGAVPYTFDVSYTEVDPGYPTGVNTLTVFSVETLGADLGGGHDSVTIYGTELDDNIRVTATSAAIRTTNPVSLSNHESIRVESLGGDDWIDILNPIAIDVHVDAGTGDNDRLVVAGPSANAQFYPFEDARSGRLVTQRQGAPRTIDYAGVETLAAGFDNWDTAVTVFADDGENDITVNHDSDTHINIDDRTKLEFFGLSSYATIRVDGLKGADRFATTLSDQNIQLFAGGSDSFDTVTFYAQDAEYRPDATFSNGRANLSLAGFDEIIVEADSLLARSDETIPSAQFRATGSDDPQAKAVTFVVPGEGNTIPRVRILGADRETVLNDPEFPSEANGGVAFAAGNLDAHGNVYFDVASSEGQSVSSFELFAAVIESDELIDIPTGGQIAVQIDHNHRVAGRGTVPFGGNSLISVQIDHNHRIAAVVNNDPTNSGNQTHSVLEVLDATGETVLASGSNIAGASGNGLVTNPLPAGTFLVRISNNNAVGEGNFEVVIFDVNDDNAVTAKDGPFPFSGSLEPGQHGAGSLPATRSTDDVVTLSPLGKKQSTLQFNDATPLQLRDVATVGIDALGGSDLLRVIGSEHSDSIALLGHDLFMNNQPFIHNNFESFSLSTGAGDDEVGVSQSLSVTGYLHFDGSDGTDRLAMQLNGPSAQFMLPDALQDSRLVTSVAVEAFSLTGSLDELGNATDIIVSGVADISSSLTVTPQTVDSVDITSGLFNASLTTAGNITISAATPPLGSEQSIRQIMLKGTVFDDKISVSDSEVDFDGAVKSVGLLNIPSVVVNAAAGQDLFTVVPSASTKFMIDGGPPIGFGDRLEIRASAGATFFPGPENDEGTYVASGMQAVSFDHIAEHAVVAGLRDLQVQLLPDQRASVRKNGSAIEIVDLDSSTILESHPFDQTNSLQILGTTGSEDVTIDYSVEFFALPNGLEFDGGEGVHDRFAIVGTGFTQADYAMIVNPIGAEQLTVTDNGRVARIRYSAAEDLDFTGLSTFEVHSVLSIGGGTLSLETSAPVNLGLLTSISGGTLKSINTIVLGPGATLDGFGAISGPFAGDVGSLVNATGDLTIGDALSTIGFATRGELEVGGNLLELLDANQAVLGSLTSLGAAGNPGRLIAAGGMLIDFGNNVVGFGVLDSPNDSTRLLMNNGALLGNSTEEQITVLGYMKGVGTLDETTVAGTYSPGFSPAILRHGSVSYGSMSSTIIELGGTMPGSSGHDQLNHTGVATLGGLLDVLLIDGFVPRVGDSFVIIAASDGVSGEFAEVRLPEPPLGNGWDLSVEPTEVRIELVDLANIESIQFGDGTNQRSRVESIEVTFGGQVDIDADAFALLKRGASGGVVETTLTTHLDGESTVATLMFSGQFTRGLSNILVDGNYQLNIIAAGIRRSGTNLALDGDDDGLEGGNRVLGAAEVDDFYAYYGDVRGNRAVGTSEFNQFRRTYGKRIGDVGYDPLFDFNGDDAVGTLEFSQFRRNFGKQFNWE